MDDVLKLGCHTNATRVVLESEIVFVSFEERLFRYGSYVEIRN